VVVVSCGNGVGVYCVHVVRVVWLCCSVCLCCFGVVWGVLLYVVTYFALGGCFLLCVCALVFGCASCRCAVCWFVCFVLFVYLGWIVSGLIFSFVWVLVSLWFVYLFVEVCCGLVLVGHWVCFWWVWSITLGAWGF